MKYLSSRGEFLKSKKIYETPYLGEEFEINEASSYASNHGAGPFHNDIGWNDSLLGRFINHLVRKAKIAGGLMMMKNLVSRLKSEFDSILDEGYIESAPEEDKIMAKKAMVYNFLWELNKSIEDGLELVIIKNYLKVALQKVKEIEFDEKEEILKELESLKVFLDGLESKKEEVTKEVGIESMFPVMIENLKALKMIVGFSFVEPDIESENDKSKNKSKNNKEGGDNLMMSATHESLNESLNGSVLKIKKEVDENLKNVKIKGVSIDSKFLGDLITKNESYKNSIINLYKEINRYLVGDKKMYIENPKDKLFEDATTMVIKNPEGVAWKIAKFSKRAFQAKGFYDRLEGLGGSMKKFVETMEKINSVKPVEKKKENV